MPWRFGPSWAKRFPASSSGTSTASRRAGISSSRCVSSRSLRSRPLYSSASAIRWCGFPLPSSRASRFSTSPSCCTRSCTGRCSTATGRSRTGYSGFSTPCRAASRRASSRAGTSTIMPSLGRTDDDPKRAHLSPKVNKRWYKLLYCSPALFPIYFRAARRETSTYPAPASGDHRAGANHLDRRAPVGPGAAVGLLRAVRGAADQRDPCVFRVPGCLYPQPARPALRHRPRTIPPSGAR